MKIVFYGVDGAAAKQYVTDLRKKKQDVRLFHASAVFEKIHCDEIEFTDDVSEFDSDRLAKLFGIDSGENPAENDGGKGPGGKELKQRFKIGKGPGGRIYIWDTEGDRKIHSGPFETDDAAAVALKAMTTHQES